MGLESDLVESWEINARIVIYLLDEVDEESLGFKPEKGRTIRGQFCHINNVRLMWLKSGAAGTEEGLTKLDPDKATKDEIDVALKESAVAISKMVSDNIGDGKRVKGFKPHSTAFVAYLVSHESHHRGMIELSLRQAGMPISDKVSFGLWEWGSR